jgi:general stress protein YciG
MPRRKREVDLSAPSMSCREAGVRGGEVRKKELGETGYSALGKKGGTTTAARHGKKFYSAIGKMGGEVIKRERGNEYFSEMGKKGGAAVKELVAKGRAAEAQSK